MDSIDRRLLNVLQEGLPICPKPYKVLGDTLGITEAECLERVQRLVETNVVRRIGGVFNSSRMGMKSTLCAMEVPAERIDEIALFINGFSEVTHNYVRNNRLNIWFTLTATSQEQLENMVKKIENHCRIKVFNLPALKTYKIKVAFRFNE
ncbi:MAG: AsnC family transcriptional regulator [Chitinophagales bacterium]